MPKESKTFNGFGGGVNQDRDQSDLEDSNRGEDEVVSAGKCNLDNKGQVRFDQPVLTDDSSNLVAGFDGNASEFLIHDDKQYLHDGVYSIGEDVNWNKSTDYKPEIPGFGNYNPDTMASHTEGVDFSAKVDDSNHIVIFQGKSSSFGDGTTGKVLDRTECSKDDLKWFMTDNSDDWAIAWGAGHWNEETTSKVQSSRLLRTFDAAISGPDINTTAQILNAASVADGSFGGWTCTIMAKNGERLDGITMTNSVEAGQAAYSTTNWDSIGIWNRVADDSTPGFIFRTGSIDFQNNSSPYPSLAYGENMPSPDNHDLYVEAKVTPLSNTVGINLTLHTRNADNDVQGNTLYYNNGACSSKNWMLSSGQIYDNDGVRKWRRYKLLWDAATFTADGSGGSIPFVPGNVNRFSVSAKNEGNHTPAGINSAEPRYQFKDIRFIPRSESSTWDGNYYTFYQTTIKNGVESAPVRYRRSQQSRSELTASTFSDFLGSPSPTTFTIKKPAASGVAGKVYYSETEKDGTVKGEKFFICEYDYDQGVKWAGNDDFSGWSSTTMSKTFSDAPVSSTYTFESGYPDGTKSVNALYKTACTVGRQVYIGNCAVQRGYRSFDLDKAQVLEIGGRDDFVLKGGSLTHPFAYITLKSMAGSSALRLEEWFVLEDYTGKRILYYCSGTTGDNHWANTTSTTSALTDIKTCIEHPTAGHNGSIRVFGPYASGGGYQTLALTMAEPGTEGNKTIEHNFANADIVDFQGGESGLTSGDLLWITGSTLEADNDSSRIANGGRWFTSDSTVSADLATNAEGTGRLTSSQNYNFGAFRTDQDSGQWINASKNYFLNANSPDWVAYTEGGSAPTVSLSSASNQYMDFQAGDTGQWQGVQLPVGAININAGEKYIVQARITSINAAQDCDWKFKLGGTWSEILRTEDGGVGATLMVEITTANNTDGLILAQKNATHASAVRFAKDGSNPAFSIKRTYDRINNAFNVVDDVVSSGGTTKTTGIMQVRGYKPFNTSLILKGAIGRPAGFSNLTYIDLEFGGDSINVMRATGDRMFVFTSKKCVVVNVAQDVEFLEAEFENYGIKKATQVCHVGEGLAWVNTYGVYYFDGNEVTILTGEKLSGKSWGAAPCIAFWPDRSRLCVWDNAGSTIWIYSFEENIWSATHDIAHKPLSAARSDGDDLYFLRHTNGTMCKLSFSDAGATTFSGLDLKTGAIDFDNIARDKRFYKLIIRGHNLTNVKIQGNVDNGSYTDIGTCSNTAAAGGVFEDIFTIPQALRKGRTLQLKVTSSGAAKAAGVISDISIIYRNRRVK